MRTMMDMQGVINLVISTGIAAIGWFAKALWDAVAELRKDVHQIEVELPSHYLRRDEFQEGIRQIREDIQIVFKKIDNLASTKQDK